MVIAWQRNAARWRESQETRDNCEGRDSAREFVSGGTTWGSDVLLAHADQGQVATTHQTLGTGKEVTNLRTKFAIRCPARAHSIKTEQCASNVAVVSASLPCIKRLQGVQVQQGSAGDSSGINGGPFPLDGIGLHLVPAQARTQVAIERHGQAIGRTVHQLRGQ